MADSNVGKWSRWYGLLGDDPEPYGDTATYRSGAQWLSRCPRVEDWGCGKGWMSRFVEPERYWGLDGSYSKFANEVVDLALHRSQTPGLFMRHVLEHDYRWQSILDNAVASFTDRMVLVLFTPLVDATRQLAYNSDPGVPDLAFAEADITSRFGDAGWHAETIQSATQYGTETSFYLEKGP